MGIRRSLRGEAAAMLTRLGETATIDSMLDMFHSTFGNTETPESILKRFHGSEQEPDESIVSYAGKVEELFSQAVELHAIQRSQQVLLKSVFYEGLNTDIKIASSYKYETIAKYNLFKTEVRKLEDEMHISKGKSDSKKKSTCSAASRREEEPVTTGQSTEMAEMKALLEKINERIDKIEQDKQPVERYSQETGNGFRGSRGVRHQRSNGHGDFQTRPYRGHGRGQSAYTPRRPTAGKTFKPSFNCYNCGEEGHYARNCPLNE